MWQQADDGVRRTWQEAKDYCESLTYAGYSDWRLPTHFELTTIVNYGKVNPAVDTSYFSCKSDNYWSATTYADNTDSAWFVDFRSGNVNFWYKSCSNYVRCVRSGL